jgi:dTDP-4-amino-4,6-dideoxygalactose transaminase
MNIQEKTKCKVPFGTISLDTRSIQLINTQLANKMLTNGECVEEFENKFAKTFDINYAIAVSSGTDALVLSLACLQDWGVPRGSKILCPALTFVATANAIMQAGYIPKFVDIKRDTLNIDENLIEEAIDGDVRAIVVVHLMGKPANMTRIMQLANKYGLHVIEDCAEAHGAKYKGKIVGSFGLMSCYSLYAAHIITSIEGGMITTNNEVCKDILKSLRNHGLQLKGSNWEFKRIGFSSKMNELEAAIGLYNIDNFENILDTRRINYLELCELFKHYQLIKYFKIFEEEPNEYIAPHAFAIIVKDEAPFDKIDFVNFLTSKGIDNRNLFYSIPSQCEPYKKYTTNIYPEAEFCSNNGTHIGIHQDINEEQLYYIINSIKEFVSLYE